MSALALEAKGHWGYSTEVLESWRPLLLVTAADIASKRVGVGAVDGLIVGFYSLAPADGPWELDNLWVSPAFMHRGLGRQLLAHALDAARRGGASRVIVDADPNAESFYLRGGAIRCGEVAAPIPGQPGRVRPQLVFLDEALVRRLVSEQFPKWAHLPIRIVDRAGWDNRSFRLGDDMVVRLPSAAAYEAQVEKEQRWLPRLAPLLPFQIPTPVALGEPASGYPFKWSIYRWIEGESPSPESIAGSSEFAVAVAAFLRALQGIDAAGGPLPGAHNFHRGGSLGVYDAETREAIASLGARIDARAATATWESALETSWDRSPVWVHGDMALGNLLSRHGKLGAIIDFGMLGVGDPACDLSLAWTLFQGESREAFRSRLMLDQATWRRGRAWTLWKALVVAAGLARTNAIEWAHPWRIIDEVLRETTW